MAHLVDDADRIVQQAIDALIKTAGGALARLDGYPDVKVVLRDDWSRDRVAIVSGGGSGHEPAHAGFVGRGLLTAAVCGEIFASPTVDAILAAILAVTGPPGCLLIVKNYTGDRLSFGLARERARAMGLDVEMVIVGDDIALPADVKPRGIAGTLFVHKIAGAAAERGGDLDLVTELARRTAEDVRSLGVSLSGVDIPGRPSSERFPAGVYELGLGIHGEPGAETNPLGPAREISERMSHQLARRLPEDVRLAALVNNLGGLAPLELAVLVDDFLASHLGTRVELIAGPAPLMTSLNMQGLSISLLPLDGANQALLLETVAPHTAWPGMRRSGDVVVRRMPDLAAGSGASASSNPARRSVFEAVCVALSDAEAELNALDAQVGDGDTGSTIAVAARGLLGRADELDFDDAASLLGQISMILGQSMGGSSGILTSILLAATGQAAARGQSLTDALSEGLATMQAYGGAAEGDRTMIDALAPALRALGSGADISDAAAAAANGAAATADMAVARAGRSAYLAAEHLDSFPDPGAVAVAKVFAALATAAPA